MDKMTLTLNSPITEEQWDTITDVDFEHTSNIWFHTKSGKDVEFVKAIRCKDCKWSDWYTAISGKRYCYCMETGASSRTEDDFCSYAERKTDEQTD